MYSYTYSIPGQPITVTVSVDPTDMTKRYLHRISNYTISNTWSYDDSPYYDNATNVVVCNVLAGQCVKINGQIFTDESDPVVALDIVFSINDISISNGMIYSQYINDNYQTYSASFNNIVESEKTACYYTGDFICDNAGQLKVHFLARNENLIPVEALVSTGGTMSYTVYDPTEIQVLTNEPE
jgi:hypothetical protein